MADQFKPGDVVHLTCGGPLMAVKYQAAVGVYCYWFNIKNEPMEKIFDSECLVKYVPRKKHY